MTTLCIRMYVVIALNCSISDLKHSQYVGIMYQFLQISFNFKIVLKLINNCADINLRN